MSLFGTTPVSSLLPDYMRSVSILSSGLNETGQAVLNNITIQPISNNGNGGNGGNIGIGINANQQTAAYANHNIGIGTNTLQYGSNSNNLVYNNAIGYNSMQKLKSGVGNNALGANTLNNDTSGSYNIAIGDNVLNNLSSGDKNIALGNNSLNNLSSGNKNIALGNNSLNKLSSGDRNIAIGSNTVDTISSNITDTISIGTNIYLDVSNSGILKFNEKINNQCPPKNTFWFGDPNKWIDLHAGNVDISGNLTADTIYGNQLFISNITIDNAVVNNTMTNTDLSVDNICSNNICNKSLSSNDISANNLYVSKIINSDGNFNIKGDLSGNNIITNNLIIHNNETIEGELHQNAIKICLDISKNTNYAIGYNVLTNVASGIKNIGIGNQCLEINDTGSNNIGIGYQCLASNQTGCNNIAIGNNSLTSNQTGSNNIALGISVLNNSNQANQKYNIGIGKNALNNGQKSYNIAIGGNFDDTKSILSTSNTIAIGPNAYLKNNNSGIIKFAEKTNTQYPPDNTLWFGDPNKWINLNTGNINITGVLNTINETQQIKNITDSDIIDNSILINWNNLDCTQLLLTKFSTSGDLNLKISNLPTTNNQPYEIKIYYNFTHNPRFIKNLYINNNSITMYWNTNNISLTTNTCHYQNIKIIYDNNSNCNVYVLYNSLNDNNINIKYT